MENEHWIYTDIRLPSEVIESLKTSSQKADKELAVYLGEKFMLLLEIANKSIENKGEK